MRNNSVFPLVCLIEICLSFLSLSADKSLSITTHVHAVRVVVVLGKATAQLLSHRSCEVCFPLMPLCHLHISGAKLARAHLYHSTTCFWWWHRGTWHRMGGGRFLEVKTSPEQLAVTWKHYLKLNDSQTQLSLCRIPRYPRPQYQQAGGKTWLSLGEGGKSRLDRTELIADHCWNTTLLHIL